MNKELRNFLAKTLFIKDIKCIFCGKELDFDSRYCTCDECIKSLPFLRGKVCKCCGEPIKSMATYCMRCKNHIDRGFDSARAEFLYSGQIKNAIINLKYSGNKYYAEYLSAFMYDVYVRENIKCDIVIPAPISKNSLKHRGFNQAELLCEEFEKHGIKINNECLQKVLETENQAVLNFKDRQTNLNGAFKVVDKGAIKNKNVLLIDDIFTTGATASEISFTLKKAGAKRVDVITLCHDLPSKATN